MASAPDKGTVVGQSEIVILLGDGRDCNFNGSSKIPVVLTALKSGVSVFGVVGVRRVRSTGV